MKHIALTVIFILFSSIFANIIHANTNHEYEVETNHLKAHITESTCIFWRNGVKYKGSEAITHINRKEKYFAKQIVTTEDFIRLTATKSEMSGKNYAVSCEEGSSVNLRDWLLQELLSFRNYNKAPTSQPD
jgi:hypothetical protein